MSSILHIFEEEGLNSYCLNRFGERPKFCEHFAHIGNDVRIEMRELWSNKERRYKQVFFYAEITSPDYSFGFMESIRNIHTYEQAARSIGSKLLTPVR